MSQAKVQRYKEEKANRKETIKKEKMQKGIRIGIAAVVVVCLLVWGGISGYNKYDETRERAAVEVNFDSVADFFQAQAAE